MLTDQTSQSETNEAVVACTPNAVPVDQRERWIEVAQQVYGAVQEVREQADGYACRLPSDPAMLRTVAEYVSLDRLCCAFMRWTLVVEPQGGPLWLVLTGGEGSKALTRATFESTNLLNEQVAQAAGFSVAARAVINSVAAATEATTVINEKVAKAAPR